MELLPYSSVPAVGSRFPHRVHRSHFDGVEAHRPGRSPHLVRQTEWLATENEGGVALLG